MQPVLVSTGQHSAICTDSLNRFGLTPDENLKIMEQGQTLSTISTKCLVGLDGILEKYKPSVVLAQGDTTTTFIASLSAFYHKIPFMHIEAGLRTNSIWEPYPEEFNRRATALISSQSYAPTMYAAKNLIDERINPDSIYVTGNTGIDALKYVSKKYRQEWYKDTNSRVVLVTTHRRENWGKAQKDISYAVKKLSNKYPDVMFVVCLHPNPVVRESLVPILRDVDNIDLIDFPDYPRFVKLMERCDIVLTDSGGIQEEAPTFGKPVLVLRNNTERPEGIDQGNAKIVGTGIESIVDNVSVLLDNKEEYHNMSGASSPYGDGNASKRIRYLLLKYLGLESPVEDMWTTLAQ